MNPSTNHQKIRLFGIPNCDSVKKARVWLDDKGVDYEFQDFKKSPLTTNQLKNWCKHVGWETLVNKKSTTWRALSPEIQKSVTNESSACQLLVEYPSLVKRPVMWSTESEQVIVGVQPSLWEKMVGVT